MVYRHGRGDGKTGEKNLKGRSKDIIFSAVRLGKKFHRVSTGQRGTNIFPAMAMK
jgi:hypothetical protein